MMNSKMEYRYHGSPNMFVAGRSSSRVTGAVYYNSNRKPGSPTERSRRKTDSEPIAIPTSRQGSPYSPRGGSPSGGTYYAGAKFSEPPSPASLPSPPSHWMQSVDYNAQASCEISNQLKMLLNIRA